MEKKKRIWDNYKEVGEVQKTGAIKFVIAAAIHNSVKYINIREFYIRKRDGVWKPGRNGITIPLAVPIDKNTRQIKPYLGLIKLLERAAEELQTMDLYDESRAVYYVEKEKK